MSQTTPRPPGARLVLALLALLALATLGCTREKVPEGFVVLVESSPQAVDPRFVFDDIGTKISNLVFAGLVTFDTPDSAPRNVLAETVEQTSPTAWDVTLRPGLTFHDGSPLTTADVAFTFESTPALMEPIDRIEVHDERHLTFHLVEPRAPFVMSLAMGIVSRREVAARAAASGDTQATATIGAGPFRLVEGPGETVTVLDPFDDYVGGEPPVGRLVFRVVRDDNARIISLLGGSAELALNNVTPLMLPVVRDDDSLEVTTSPSIKYTYLMFNTRMRPLDDVRVRKAIAFAIDRDEIIEYKFRGLARPATGMLAPGHWAYRGEVERYDRDLERARQLLDEAGYPDPDGDEPRFSLTWRTSSSKFRKAIAELIAAQLAEVGIEVTVETMEFGTFFTLVHQGNFEMASLQWPSPVEPDLLYTVYHSQMVPWEHPEGHGRNRGGFANAELDEVLEQARTSTDRQARRALYGRAQEILADELPYVPLWHEDNIAVMRRGVRAFSPTPNARLSALEDTTY